MTTTAQQAPFKIFVGGDRPADALLGYLEKGNATIKGKSQKANAFGGFVSFPNYTKGWGRRVVKGKPTDTDGHDWDITDKEYKGEVEWMPYGKDGGYDIYARYLSGKRSLDHDYQVTRLGVPKVQDDEQNAYLTMPYGENTIFPSEDKAWAEMVKIHYMNDDSVCKMPSAEGSMYKEVKSFDTKKENVKALNKEFDAFSLVREADTYEKLDVLRKVLSDKIEIQEDKKDENSLYENLALYSKSNPGDFLEAVATFKRNISDLIEKAKAWKSFDLTLNGVVVAGLKKRETLLNEVPAKGDAMITWMFDNCLQPDVFHAFEKLEQISSQQFK